MEDKSSRKRQFFEDPDSNKQTMQKRVRFPKGKKVKPVDEVVDKGKAVDDGQSDLKDPRLAAKERANRRSQITFELCSEESRGIVNDISAAEVTYQENENFVDDGIHIEPFNLDKEREEGYFDAEGNFVEYVNDNEIKDAWLDSLEIDQRFAGSAATHNENVKSENEDDIADLSSEEIGIIKRRIANVLEPGETVTQALRRLKGTSNNKKEKMPAETKRVFDQLTEDAMKLMEENGEYNVYSDKQETFEREAEGYERLAQLRGKGTSVNAGQGNPDSNGEKYMLSNVTDPGTTSSLLSNSVVGTSGTSVNATGIPSSADDSYDMFGDDDENATTKPSADELNSVSDPNSNAASQLSSDGPNTASEDGSLQNDYVYDESSGYYYSSSLGYYYDPSTGLYCLASSGQWYSYNEETGAYEEVHEVAPSEN